MKNNEIMISAKFVSEGISDEISFLVLKDITLKAFIESIYFGLKKSNVYDVYFDLLEEYLKTRKELQVLYSASRPHQPAQRRVLQEFFSLKAGQRNKRLG